MVPQWIYCLSSLFNSFYFLSSFLNEVILTSCSRNDNEEFHKDAVHVIKQSFLAVSHFPSGDAAPGECMLPEVNINHGYEHSGSNCTSRGEITTDLAVT